MLGQTITNYRLTAILGEGGFGTVYQAEHTQIDRKVAVKLLHPRLAHDADVVARFLNEARAAAAVRHENIIEVFDAGLTPEGTPYIVMELLAGAPLSARLARSGRLAVAEALDFALQTASALGVAHAAGIVHRDLKPENLFVTPDERQPAGGRIKVLDFGIAKLRDRGHVNPVMTREGSCLGSPAYMSPEQWQGRSDVDRRTDIYALGVILYEMLSGSPPFLSADVVSMQAMHLTAAPSPLRHRNPAVPESIDIAVLKALAKDPRDRFGEMEELAGALGGGKHSRVRPGSTAILPTGGPGKTAETLILPDAPDGAGAGATVALPTTNRSTFSRGAGELAARPARSASTSVRPSARNAGLAALSVVGGIIAIACFVPWRHANKIAHLDGGSKLSPPEPRPRHLPTPGRETEPPEWTAPRPVLTPPPPARVEIQIDSDPSDAEVTNLAEDRQMGRTPLSISVPQGSNPLRLRIGKPGYQSATEIVLPEHDGRRRVTLVRINSHPAGQPTRRIAL